MPATGVPLTDEDRTILAIESPTVAGHTCKVIVVEDGFAGLDALRASVAQRLPAAGALTTRLGGPADAPEWVPDPAFALEDHVTATPAAPGGLRGTVAALFTERLDRTRPLWHLDVVALDDGTTALVWRIHHALADGTAAMRFAKALLWDDAGEEPARPLPHPAAPAGRDRRRVIRALERDFAPHPGRSPFDKPIGCKRDIAFASTALAPLHDAAKALEGATVNDAVLTVVGGGVRRWLNAHHGHLGSVRVKVPVSLHDGGDDAGNRDSFFVVEVPVHEADPAARLRVVHRGTAARKRDHDAETLDGVLRQLTHVSPRLKRFCDRVEASPRSFALNVSNVPGPRRPVSVLGTPVRSLHSIAEIGERHALRVTVVSCAGSLYYGLCGDPDVVDDLDALASGIQDDAAELVAAAS